MKKSWIIFLVILTSIIIALIFIKNNIKNNITGKFTKFELENIRGVLDPLADIKVFFEVINTSRFNFTVRDLTVKIYNKNTSEFLTENRVKTTMYIPIGVSTHNVELLDNRIVGDINSFLNGETKYLAIISFRFLGVKIEFEQLIEL